MCHFQPRKLFVLIFVGLLYQFIQCGGMEFLYKQGIGQRDNILVVLLAIIIIWASGQSIRAVLRTRPMMNFEVVVGQGEDISSYALVNLLRMSIM